MANEVIGQGACEFCKRPVGVRVTIKGKGYYRCFGEFSDDMAHCGRRVTFGVKETKEFLAAIQKSGANDNAATRAANDNRQDQGKPEGKPERKSSGFLGDW